MFQDTQKECSLKNFQKIKAYTSLPNSNLQMQSKHSDNFIGDNVVMQPQFGSSPNEDEGDS